MRNNRESKIISIRCCVVTILFLLFTYCAILEVNASVQDNPYITFSPDGEAFTTNADERNTVWYQNGYTVYTGKSSTLREVEKGEHLYAAIRKDHVPVKKWVVTYPSGQCIHDDKPGENYFHGVKYSTTSCFKPYYSGWIGYCADCDQKVINAFFYMSEQAALSLKELDMSLAYYYRCPWCTNLEMGVELKQHSCQAISANQYSVRYHANFGSGYMMKSIHMYNNTPLYEGNVVTPQKNLTLNSFTRFF